MLNYPHLHLIIVPQNTTVPPEADQVDFSSLRTVESTIVTQPLRTRTEDFLFRTCLYSLTFSYQCFTSTSIQQASSGYEVFKGNERVIQVRQRTRKDAKFWGGFFKLSRSLKYNAAISKVVSVVSSELRSVVIAWFLETQSYWELYSLTR